MPGIDLDIDALVPHRRPMRLIDEVLEVSGDTAITMASVTAEWPTFADGAVQALVVIELVAQTAAVVGGYKAITDPNGDHVRKGMLVGIKRADFQLSALPLDTRITTSATTRPLLENFKEIRGFSKIGDQIIGEIVLQGVQVA